MRTHAWKPVLVLILSVALTLLAVRISFLNADAKDLVRFENRYQRTEDLIRSRVNAYVVLLRAAGYFFASQTPGSISEKDFRAFVERLDIQRSHPGIVRLGYSRRDDSGGFRVSHAAPPSDALRDYEIGRDPELRAALASAARSGAPAAADHPGPPLIDDPGGGFFMCVPVYREGYPPEDPALRPSQLEAYVFGVCRLRDLFRDLYSGPNHPGIAFEIFEGERAAAGARVFASEKMSLAAAVPQFTHESTLKIADHAWTIRYVTVPPFQEGSTRAQGWIALLLGLGASGALFWAAWSQHEATVRLRRSEDDVRRLNLSLERRVAERTEQLEAANRELEAFSYSVSHDLRGPLRSIDGFSQMLMDQFGEKLDERGRDYLARVLSQTAEMDALIDGFLKLARVSRSEMKHDVVDLSATAEAVVRGLRARDPERVVEVAIEPGIQATGDAGLFRAMLDNLLSNAWKFTSRRSGARIGVSLENGACVVRDNGVGFDMRHSARLFKPFERMHSANDFPGTGIGLATVRRVVERHGGTIRAEAEPEKGAAFIFTLPELRRPAVAEVKT